SSRSNMQISSDYTVDRSSRKVVHFVVYGALCAALYRATGSFFAAILLSGLYGAFDEYHQLFTPLRSGKIADVVIDLAGACFSALIIWKFYPRLPQKLKNWLKP
ncbi:MAG: VanZ family protein, partial [bacterium]